MKEYTAQEVERAVQMMERATEWTKKHNEYIARTFKQLKVAIPRTWEEDYNNMLNDLGETSNALIKRLILEEMTKTGHAPVEE